MHALLPALLTADEFLAVGNPDTAKLELVRGVVRAMSPGNGGHGSISTNLVERLAPYVRAHRLGRVFGDNTGFLLPLPIELRRRSPDGEPRDTVRSPDAAFLRRSKVPPGGFGRGWVRAAPDFAVEVLSPDETTSETDEKLDDYRAAGTSLLWVVDAATRRVTVYAADAPTRWFCSGDTLDGGTVIPGFAIPVDDLFEDVAVED
jgi:Uma2 family endonuclease